MQNFTLSKSFTWQGIITDKVKALCRMFGLTTERLTSRTVTHCCRLNIIPGDIIMIAGPSGSGKTVLLNELRNNIPPEDRISLDRIALPRDRTLIDCFDTDLITTIRLLSTAGLNDVFCLLNQPVNLSEGEQYRFRLALALSMSKPYIFADEFCSGLDRLTAATIAHKIRMYATKTSTTFVIAAAQEDFGLDLKPDVLVLKSLNGDHGVIYKDEQRMSYPSHNCN
jgi:uncharacterized protein